MLAGLSIRNIVLIDRLDLELGSGLTVLTGETGAGKSILLDAFALAIGGRGDGSLVRTGQDQGQVTAVFDIGSNHPAVFAARNAGADVDGELILRRVQMSDGRTRAFINDQPVSVQSLKSVGSELVEIHGQHDDRALVDPAMHRALLDAFGRLGGQAKAVRQAHGTWRMLGDELASERARVEAALKEADFLRHAHAELSDLAPQADEEEALAARRIEMQQSEKVAGDLREAHEAIDGNQPLAHALSGIVRRLERRAPQAPVLLEAPLKALEEAMNSVELAGQVLAQALRDCEFDPHDLETTEERLFALRAAARKYSVPVSGLDALAQRFAGDLADLQTGEARVADLEIQVRTAHAALLKSAHALSQARKKTARDLDLSVKKELAPLKLENAVFTASVETRADEPGPDGLDWVEFWVQTNPGTRPGPMMKVASGGELARFMLALKVSLADRGSAPCLVFDEIDTGVGGAVADAIGQRLARLGTKVQVLAVTHAPQVAARASTHMRISKSDAAGKGRKKAEAAVATRITTLASEDRREEIARMLAGASVTDEARAAAARLLESASSF
ncbi:MAG: DNA repair protein RecN [Beijerinckiaceae bacterium]|jgi:DNA repair protein RecN (Recombination protein N)|nr:DNA repair protein RecN [Beijerinckiaceae bacterium]